MSRIGFAPEGLEEQDMCSESSNAPLLQITFDMEDFTKTDGIVKVQGDKGSMRAQRLPRNNVIVGIGIDPDESRSLPPVWRCCEGAQD